MKPDNDQATRRNTKEKILNAAIDLFSERGFSAVSVRDITRSIGVNESTLYNHFTNKDELLEVIIELFRREFGLAFKADGEALSRLLEGATPDAFLHHHILGLRDRLTPRVVKVWRIIYLELFRNARIRAFYTGEALRASANYYEKAFALMMEKGMIRRGDARALAQEFNYAVIGLQLENLLLAADSADVSGNSAGFFTHIRFFCEAIK